MSKFFEQFEQFLLKEKKDKLGNFIPHYENLLQHKESILVLLDESLEWNYSFHYEKDKHSGYTDGSLTIYLHKNVGELIEDDWGDYYEQEHADYHYVIDFLHDDRYWGYCMCKPDYEGYSEKHKCCGNGCDWVAPRFELKKIESLAQGSFNGVERDLWKLEEKWKEHLQEHEEKIKKQELEYIEKQLMELEEKKNNLLGL